MLSIRSFPAQPFFSGPRLQIRAIGIRETMPPCSIERPQGEGGDCLLMIFHSPFQVGQAPCQRIEQGGHAVFWNRGEAQYYGNPSMRWSHSWIHCDGPDVTETLRDSGVVCGQPIPLGDPARVERYLQNIYEDVTGSLELDPQILRNTLVNLIREAARSGGRPQNVPTPEVLLRARQTIETRYDERLELKTLAHEAHLSVPHFCSQFRHHFGVSPIAYLIQRRLEAAATLLRCTSLDVGEVGQRVGYSDIYHFSKLFKQHFAVPPSRFRGAAATLVESGQGLGKNSFE